VSKDGTCLPSLKAISVLLKLGLMRKDSSNALISHSSGCHNRSSSLVKQHSGNLFWQSGRRPQPHCVGWVTDRLLKSHTIFCTCPFGWRQMVRVPLCVDASPRSLARGAVELDLLLDSLKPESTLEPGSEQSTPSCPAAYCSSSYW